MSDWRRYLVDPAMLVPEWPGDDMPVAVVDLDRAPRDGRAPALPPLPVIGVGDAGHPLAARLDAVAEPPVPVAAVVAGAARHPLAAAALVQLLRATEGLAPGPALVLESATLAMLQGSAEHAGWLAARPPAPRPPPPGTLRVARAGDALRLVIDRPGARNAIDRAMRDALFEALTAAAADPELASVELRAAGRAFGTGADLAEFGTTRDPASAHAIRARTLPALPMSRCADRVTAHVQGACVGASLELAAFAGRVTAAPDAWFQLPELAMGIIPGAGGCVSVPRRIGRGRAALMMLSGRRIGAAVALAWGLVDAIGEGGEERPPPDPGGADRD